MSNQPIGIFDSGVGGLTIWKVIRQNLPYESIIYLADQKNCPYGSRNKNEIIELTEKSIEYLLHKDCKLIIIACNTATALAISKLREKYSYIPFVGLEPAVKPAALNTKKKVIGVLATANTLVGDHFLRTSEEFGKHIKINSIAGTGLVELIENNLDTAQLNRLLKKYLEELDYKNIDYIVLGCTHYPLIIKNLRMLCGDSIKIIDSAEAVSRQVEKLLDEQKIKNDSKELPYHHFFSTSSSDILKSFLNRHFYEHLHNYRVEKIQV